MSDPQRLAFAMGMSSGDDQMKCSANVVMSADCHPLHRSVVFDCMFGNCLQEGLWLTKLQPKCHSTPNIWVDVVADVDMPCFALFSFPLLGHQILGCPLVITTDEIFLK